MCSDCEADEPQPLCGFCGETCYGSCGDIDQCQSCWIQKNDHMCDYYDDTLDEETMDECMDSGCRCACHDDLRQDMGLRFEHGVWKDEDTEGPPFIRKGVFPFLKLPAELRDKVYGFALLQDGNRRSSPYHRGTIHTALLGTGRQVYREAVNMPLSLNTLNFSSALYALNFLGFLLVQEQASLITSMHIEFFYHEFSSPSWELLMRQLAKMPISHLSLTVKGRCWKEAFLGHTCFPGRFAAVLKNVKAFDIKFGSALITQKSKDEIQEEMRETLIKGYKRPKKAIPKTKRGAASDAGDKKPAKKAKKVAQKVRDSFAMKNC